MSSGNRISGKACALTGYMPTSRINIKRDWHEELFGVGAPLGLTVAEHAAMEAEMRRLEQEGEPETEQVATRFDRRYGLDGER